MSFKFPASFHWGTATSAFQIEGAWNEAGKGESIWDRFSHRRGVILNDDCADIACDHYHRMSQDVELMKELKIQAYRFSISWPRVLPQGYGTINSQGLGFYDRLVDKLLEAKILPNATLNHWDLPQAIQEQGGWPRRETCEWFAEYARLMFDRLGDRVTFWATHNEPWVVAALGYGQGVFAPGIADASQQYQAAHHLLLAHGSAVQIYRQGGYKLSSGQAGKIGIVLNTAYHLPASESDSDQMACQRADDDGINFFMDAIFHGFYPRAFFEWIGPHTPQIQQNDMELICQPIDFLGINYYMTFKVAFAPWGGLLKLNLDPVCAPLWSATKIGFGVNPEGLKQILIRFKQKYGNPVIYLTENGCSLDETPDQNGFVKDWARVDYIRAHLRALGEALEDGVDVRGYYLWSLLDNWEWAHGYAPRFGIVRVDYPTGERIPKQSAYWYRDLITNHAILND